MNTVITGCGIVSAAGSGREAFSDALFRGETLTDGDKTAKDNIAGGSELSPVKQKYEFDRLASAYRSSAEEALRAAGLLHQLPEPLVVINCTRSGCPPSALGLRAPAWIADRTPLLQEIFGIQAAITHVSAACASCGFALELAQALLRGGRVKLVAVVGGELVTPQDRAGMRALRALARGVARPFDAERDGIVLGMGAGCVVVEEESHARRRGVSPLARLEAVATRVSPSSRTDTDREGLEWVMRSCLSQALGPIDHIHAHATGTRKGDADEAFAINTVFPNQKIGVSSHKGFAGHWLYASGFASMAFALEAIDRGDVPPTIGLLTRDETLPIQVGRGSVDRIDRVMMNAAGFFGNYSAAVVARA